MITLGMSAGDLLIDERGQPTIITGRNKLIQDISEALNSSFNANKRFGGRLIDFEFEYNELYDEIYSILNRLMATQIDTSPGEKIKTINTINILKRGTIIYAYIQVTSDIGEVVDNDYIVLGR